MEQQKKKRRKPGAIKRGSRRAIVMAARFLPLQASALAAMRKRDAYLASVGGMYPERNRSPNVQR